MAMGLRVRALEYKACRVKAQGYEGFPYYLLLYTTRLMFPVSYTGVVREPVTVAICQACIGTPIQTNYEPFGYLSKTAGGSVDLASLIPTTHIMSPITPILSQEILQEIL